MIRAFRRSVSRRAGWLAAVLTGLLLGCGAGPQARLDGVVLVVIDTLRADRLGAYGNERATSPVIDALARRGVLFEQAISPSSWTLPSLIGLLTGRFPSREVFQNQRLVDSAIEVLERGGVRTAAFTEGGFASARFGLSRGFETFEERPGKVKLARAPARGGDPTEVISRNFADAERFLRSLGDERFFLLVHTYEPHMPYQRGIYIRDLEPGAFGESFGTNLRRIQRGELRLTSTERSYVAALYDGGVRVSDAHVGRLMRALHDTGRDRSTAVIVTSDHGEHLGERTPSRVAEHGYSLYDDLIHVPLVLYDPLGRFRPRRISTQVSTLDVAPTVLELLGVEPPPSLDGRSLVPVLRGEETKPRIAFSHVHRTGPPRLSLRDGHFKLIRDLRGAAGGGVEIYDLAQDPGETHDLAASGAGIPTSLVRELDRFQAELTRRGPLDFPLERAALPEGLRNQLRVLGYLPAQEEGAAGVCDGAACPD